jgi:signal peptidase I
MRIVGIPGDVVVLDGAALVVNGVRATAAEAAGELRNASGRRFPIRTEALDGRRYRVLDDPKLGARFGPQAVEPGRYFLLGDNRDDAYDSRSFGSVARADVVAPTGRIWWSWPFAGDPLALLEPGALEKAWRAVRWERIGLDTNPAPGKPAGDEP